MLSKKPVLIILSIITAMFLWVYVTGNVDPDTKSKVSNITVNLVNTEELANQGLAVSNEDELTASTVITGKRSVVNKIKYNGIKATVDVGKAQKGENELPLEFEVPAGVSIDNSVVPSVNVIVEDRISKTVPVNVVFTGEDKVNLKPWATEIWPETVTVYGASSLVNKTVAAEAVIDAADAETAARNISADVMAVDKSGKEVQGLAYDRDSIMVTVQLLESKDVGVDIKKKGLTSRYRVSDITGIETVTVLGPAETLKNIDSITAYADLSEIKSGGVTNVKVEPDLPYGVYLPGGIKQKAKVTIKVAD